MRKMIDSGVEWLGAIPQDWDLVQIKSIASCKSEKSSYIGGAYIGLEHIESGSGKLLADGSQTGIEVDSTVSSFSDTDILFGKLRPYLAKAAKPNFDGQCSTEILVLNPSSRIQKDFLFWYLLDPAFIDAVNASTYGAKMPRANWNFIGSCYLPLPPMNMQTVISSVLNEKFAQVDTLIANVQAQIEKLKAYKQSVITEVVTKGLDPTVPMKDSGVEWIGEIPAHWGVTRIKNMFELRNERNDEADLTKVNLISLYTDLGVVQHSDLTATTGNRAVTAEGYKIVRKNDIVVNIILCWMGAVGMSQYDGVTSPAYDIYRPLKDTNSEYYHYLFRTNRFNGECYRYGRGIMMMRWRTYSTEFRAINIPCPPAEEQKKIVAHLNEKCNKIDQLSAIKQAKIEKLEQYKRSLIYEYVTGKREVV